MPAPSFAQLHAEGLATILDEAGIATYDFRGSSPYTTETEWPIYIGKVLPATPHRIINLSPGIQSFRRADVMTSVQIRLRGLPNDGDNTVDDEVASKHQEILDFLYPWGEPKTHFQMGEIRIGAVFPGDTLPIEADGQRRSGVLQNFRFRARRVSRYSSPSGE